MSNDTYFTMHAFFKVAIWSFPFWCLWNVYSISFYDIIFFIKHQVCYNTSDNKMEKMETAFFVKALIFLEHNLPKTVCILNNEWVWNFAFWAQYLKNAHV